LFSANANGKGIAAAVVQKLAADKSQTSVFVFTCGSIAGSCAPAPIDFGCSDRSGLPGAFRDGNSRAKLSCRRKRNCRRHTGARGVCRGLRPVCWPGSGQYRTPAPQLEGKRSGQPYIDSRWQSGKCRYRRFLIRRRSCVERR